MEDGLTERAAANSAAASTQAVPQGLRIVVLGIWLIGAEPVAPCTIWICVVACPAELLTGAIGMTAVAGVGLPFDEIDAPWNLGISYISVKVPVRRVE